MKTWQLRTGADRRIRSGHPWIFSNELSASPKGHPQGDPIRLLDGKGQFVAAGYGNPQSLISFRALSFDPQVANVFDIHFLVDKFLQAWRLRFTLGFNLSARLVYGEGDFFPGLVVDRYVVEQNQKRYQVLAAQVLTAGISEALKANPHFFQSVCEEAKEQGLSSFSWAETAVVLRNDVNIRKLEGLEVEPPQIIKNIEGLQLNNVEIVLKSAAGDDEVLMTCDLFEGQKTGFFLDQMQNIRQLCELLKNYQPDGQTIRILDLCCYVGHWSTQLTKLLKSRGYNVEVCLVDVSDPALKLATQNSEREGAKVETWRLDVVKELDRFSRRDFDIVIADPPAFIKAKKDVPTGKHAYLKLNTSAFKFAKRGGLVVSCSCSGLFIEEEMKEVLRKAMQRSEREARCVLHGGHSPDHPVSLAFPEGFYLKMFTHFVVEKNT